MTLPDVAPLVRLTDGLCAALRARFAAVGFDDSVHAVASDIEELAREAIRLPLVHATLAHRSDPASRVALLLTFAGTLPVDDARDALTPALYDALCEVGVLAPSVDGVRAAYRVTPIAGLWLLSDHFAGGADMVMQPSGTTGRLLAMMPARIAGAALDLGCGPGAFALVAAKRGAHPSVGTDVSERAVAMARFNARLNGLDAEFRLGSLCEPVAGMRFDLVVSQPPYVVRPDDSQAVTYMHGGQLGDELALRFVTEAPTALAPGGRALLSFDSAARSGRDPVELVAAALGDAEGVDALVVTEPGPSVNQCKISYASIEAPEMGAPFAKAVQRYHAHLTRLGVERFETLLVVLQRRAEGAAGDRWVVRVPARSTLSANAETLDVALACIALAAADDETLAASALQTCPAACFVDERPGLDPRVRPRRAYRFGEGTFGGEGAFEEREFALLSFVSGAPTVGEGAAAFAARTHEDPAAVRAEALQFARAQLIVGVLEPRGLGESTQQ